MNYEQTLDYLFKQLPMYQRLGAVAYKIDLSNTLLLCNILGSPENKFKSIHVAGTNGKGSTSHMVASIMQEAGYKVGLYTSPHLKDFRERIKINGQMITEEEVIGFVEKYRSKFEEINLSFFEWTVGLAFDYFKVKNVDIAIIEVGLGGRLDSTNVISPELSIITNIGIDHTQFLGNTLELIAVEKAGIIKPEKPIVIGETQEEIKSVFSKLANEKRAPICFADIKIDQTYETDLKGSYQIKNQKTCLATIQILTEKGWNISIENIKNGLKSVVTNTGLLGRWQVMGHAPLIIYDIGHNREGIDEIVKQLTLTKHNNLHIVWGAVKDKSIGSILEFLPKSAHYYFCEAKIPRALDVNELFKLAEQKGLKGSKFESVIDALKSAEVSASSNDIILVGGSTFVVAEVL